MCWFCGEYIVARSIFSAIILLVCLAILFMLCDKVFIIIYKRVFKCGKSCCYYFVYDTAKIVPLPLAKELESSDINPDNVSSERNDFIVVELQTQKVREVM